MARSLNLAETRAGFPKAMRRLTGNVAIISTGRQGAVVGMTATAVCSPSPDPPSLLVCIHRSASISPRLELGEPFYVNLLAAQHAPIAMMFAGKAPPGDRFSNGAWNYDEAWMPYLADARCNLFCDVDLATDYTSHTMVIGKVGRVLLPDAGSPSMDGQARFRTEQIDAITL